MNSPSSYDWNNPAQLVPLFTTQQVTCAYPVSDFYASVPRYLYYALLVACIATQWHPWLANVFLGAAATYAGTAAIEAFILLSHWPKVPSTSNVTIPLVTSAQVTGNETFESLMPNLITDTTSIQVAPYTMELDIDPILAIIVTATLFMLPMHCWSSKIRKHRAVHLLMATWNLLTLSGTICALSMWPRLYDVPGQYRFCYPNYVDDSSTDNDGWQSDVWQGNWNSTVWNTFQNVSVAFQLPDNCLYPCFNTSQILRQSSSITATLAAVRADLEPTSAQYNKVLLISELVLVAIIVTAVITAFLLVVGLTRARTWLRVPVHQPRLLWVGRKELAHTLRCDLQDGLEFLLLGVRQPKQMFRHVHSRSSRQHFHHLWHVTRFVLDVLALVVLLSALILCPAVIVIFLVWIEWYIHRDIVSKETAAQVGQWSGPVSIGLVLVSACILKLKYTMASEKEIDEEMNELEGKLDKLKTLKLERENHRKLSLPERQTERIKPDDEKLG